MSRAKREPREIKFAEIERRFELASYWFGRTWCPAVDRRDGGGYSIRLVKSETVTLANRSVTYDYFEMDDDGLIWVAPRGYARDFKPGRVVDIEAAVERYTTPPDDATRIVLPS